MERVTLVRHTAERKVAVGSIDAFEVKNYKNKTNQKQEEMNTKNPEMKKMTYETYKQIDSQPKKECPKFKQSKHDYTIRSEWGAEAFEF